MEMKKINSGRLRAIGYDAPTRVLQVHFDDGSALQYGGVGEEMWRRFSSSGAAWSFYRDNIEEELTAKRVSANVPAGSKPLDELFRKPWYGELPACLLMNRQHIFLAGVAASLAAVRLFV